MGDDEQRRLERQFKQSGSVEDGSAWLRERMRTGQLSTRAVLLSAYLGSEIATASVGSRATRPSAMQRQSNQTWIQQMVTIAGDAPWREELERRIVIGGICINLPLWAREQADMARETEGLPSDWVDLLTRIAEESEGLPSEACTERTLELFDTLRQRIGDRVDAEDQARPRNRYSEDDDEDDIMRRHMEDDTPATDLQMSVTVARIDLEKLQRILTGQARLTFQDVERALRHGSEGRPDLASRLEVWLLGPDGPTSSALSTEALALPQAPVVEGDEGLVAALEALEIRSPAKRMFVKDLRRLLDGGEELSEGQRERAAALYGKLHEA